MNNLKNVMVENDKRKTIRKKKKMAFDKSL
jgi:hypothetical protein